MSNPWQALADELAQWQGAGETATLWWRDDDAVAATAELDDILEIAAAADVPLALAVIAAGADDGLAARLTETRASTSVLVHGLDHQNKAAAGEKKTELAASRPTAEMKTDLEQARARLQTLFGDRCLPVLVPPWNRISADLVPLLAACGYRGLSTYKARQPDPQSDTRADTQADTQADQLQINNCHVDLINWKAGKVFVGEEEALSLLTLHLSARRQNGSKSSETTGILTHHLVQDAKTRDFLQKLLFWTREQPTVRWLDAREVFKLC
jgi:hypothetical protein